MLNQFSRTELLLGSEALAKLADSRVAVFGIGGVGSYVVEGLARSGVGSFMLVDADTISLTNVNRQLHATMATIGQPKVEAMRARILAVNPAAAVDMEQSFYLPETSHRLDLSSCDYIVDAIDTVSGKIGLVLQARRQAVPIISCLGAGNKLDPTQFEVADIYETSVCPLARVMRHELRRHGVDGLKVVYSREVPLKPKQHAEEEKYSQRQVPGSVAFVPSVAGLIIAGEVVKDLVGWQAQLKK